MGAVYACALSGGASAVCGVAQPVNSHKMKPAAQGLGRCSMNAFYMQLAVLVTAIKVHKEGQSLEAEARQALSAGPSLPPARRSS